jgi:hypothetical protein
MWNRLLLRLLSLSFMSFFVIGLLWQEGRRRGQVDRPDTGKDRPRRRDTIAEHR